MLVGSFGSFRVAAGCMIAVASAMLLGMTGNTMALVAAGLVLGMAFGPETPASSALLNQLARPEQRSLVFSFRQCGNQIGAIFGSLTLPALAMIEPRAGYMLITGVALCAAVLFAALSRSYDPLVLRPPERLRLKDSLRLIRQDRHLRDLAIFSIPLSALQLALNAYLVIYLVGVLGLDHITAGIVLGIAQAGGLVGRLGWGGVATRIAPFRLIGLLAIGAALFAVGIALLPVGTSPVLLSLLTFGFGLTASGWNGIFLGEVAASAPRGRTAEATGAVLTASYTGLLLGPALIALLSEISGLRLAYLFLAASSMFVGIRLLRSRHE